MSYDATAGITDCYHESNFDEYQREARRFARYEHGEHTVAIRNGRDEYRAEIYPFLALAEEAGEVAGKIAKAMRKGEPVDVEALEKELGDVQWQLAACASELGLKLSRVVHGNLTKLSGREAAGTLAGEGDER